MRKIMKPRRILVAVVGLASGLLLNMVPIVHADDRDSRNCSNASLKGSYGFYRTGPTPTGPVAAVGILSFDGYGNWTVTQSRSLNGIFNFDTTLSGTYEVAEDCSAKEFFNGLNSARIVIVDGGMGFYSLSVSSNLTVYAVGRKIHTRDDGDDH
jgi:hypothetical protein